VSNMLREFGFPIVDADIISRQVVEIGERAYNEIVKAFGEDVLQQDGTLDRIKLGSIVFNDELKRKQLNNIVHPAVRSTMLEQKEQYLQAGAKAVILDIPLLFESQLTYMVDKTIVVYVNRSIQLQRLMERNDFSEPEALARINSQMPLQEKKELSDEVINNNGTLQETKAQLEHILTSWNLL
jgi:dephospho-CoA kinase